MMQVGLNYLLYLEPPKAYFKRLAEHLSQIGSLFKVVISPSFNILQQVVQVLLSIFSHLRYNS